MTQPNENDIAKATDLYSTHDGQNCVYCGALCPDDAGKLIDAIAQALADERDATWDAAIEEVWAFGRECRQADVIEVLRSRQSGELLHRKNQGVLG